MVRETRNENIDDDTRARAAEYVRKNTETSSDAPAKKSGGSFSDAFARARKSGAKDFEFNGKKYTTQLASEKRKATAPASHGGENRSSSRSESAPTARSSQSPRTSYGRGVEDTLKRTSGPKAEPASKPMKDGALAFGPKLSYLPREGAKSPYDKSRYNSDTSAVNKKGDRYGS